MGILHNLRLWLLFFRPSGAVLFSCVLPMACAMGCILSPLCGCLDVA